MQNFEKITAKLLRHMWRKIPTLRKIFYAAAFLASSVSSHAFCFNEAAQLHKVNPQVLEAIAMHESRLNPATVVQNTNGTEDVGLSGINSVHLIELAKFGIGKAQLLDACTNLKVGAWLMSKKIAKYGNSWAAIGAYHSQTPAKNLAYQLKVYAELLKIQSRDGKTANDEQKNNLLAQYTR